MTKRELAQMLAKAPRGAEVRIPAGEYEGPWHIKQTLHLIGSGAATVLWSAHGPTLILAAPGIRVQELAVEVTEENDGVALLIDQQAQVSPPAFVGVRILGRAEGPGSRFRWSVPTTVDFGVVTPASKVTRTVGLEIAGDLQIENMLAGLEVQVEQLGGQRVALNLRLDGRELQGGSLLEGHLSLSAGGLCTTVRLTGQVVQEMTPGPEHDAARQFFGQAEPSATGASGTQGGTGDSVAEPLLPRSWLVGRPRLFDRGIAPPAPSGTPTAAEAREPVKTTADLRQAAQEAFERREVERAVALLHQAQALAPGESATLILLAGFYSAEGLFWEAAGVWNQVLVLEPAHPSARQEIALCYRQVGRYTEALALLEQAVRTPVPPPDAGLYRMLAMTYAQLARYEEALWALDRAQALNFDAKLNALRRVWEIQQSRERPSCG